MTTATIGRRAAIIIALVTAIAVVQRAKSQQPDSKKASVVTISKTQSGNDLLRNGEPYFIKGAGGMRNLELLAAVGGNSIRTWRPDNVRSVLDRGDELGLSVTIGIWLAHERHGFDYSDSERVARQFEAARQAVRTHKDHPALLMWAVGNEMEGRGRNAKVWRAVNDIARMIKQEDPNHPTMTVIAGASPTKIEAINEHCPDIDIIGVNAYGDLSDLPQQMKERGMTRPYIITEFGPFGWWQVKKTSWGEELEPTSTEKAATYLKSYKAAVAAQKGWCFGSYAFLWGDKQEHTRTWFGMFLPEGQRTAAIDAISYCWTGDWPKNRCPEIEQIRIVEASSKSLGDAAGEAIYPPGAKLVCEVKVRDIEGDAVRVRWELRSASTDKRSGGDPEIAPPDHPDAIVSTEQNRVVLKLPATPGPYRLFAYAYDTLDGAATTNLPILVRKTDDKKTIPTTQEASPQARPEDAEKNEGSGAAVGMGRKLAPSPARPAGASVDTLSKR